MVYCISDIHGDFEAYSNLLEKINFSDRDMLYVLGDVIDRGKDSIKILFDMMMRPNVIPILGNHEYAAINCLRFLIQPITEENINDLDENIIQSLLEWQNIGGQATMDEFHKLDFEDKQAILEYLEEFELYDEVIVKGKSYVMVHAGLMNFSPERDLDDYELHELIFKCSDYERVYFEDKYLVTGHLPTKAIEINPKPNEILRVNNHIAIDCGSGYDGKVGCICLDTGETFYSK